MNAFITEILGESRNFDQIYSQIYTYIIIFKNMFVVILLDMMYSVTVYSVHTVLSNPCPFLCRKIKFLKLIAFIYLCKFYLFCITFIFLSISFYLIYLMHTNCCLELSFIHKFCIYLKVTIEENCA